MAVVAVLAMLSGCEASILETGEGRHDIEIRNDDTTSHRVTLEVVDGDGDVVQTGTQVVAAGGTWDANRIAHAGEYTIRVSVDGEDRAYADTVQLPIEGEETLSVSVIRITRDGTVTGEVVIRETGNARFARADR
jgi:hypothetical protein